MREIYFNDHIDDAEYNGKLYGLGQTFTVSNGISEPVRGSAATIAEREDRGPARETHNQTPGPTQGHNAAAVAMGLGAFLQTPSLNGALPTPLSLASPYGSMGANGPYMRTAIGVGGGR